MWGRKLETFVVLAKLIYLMLLKERGREKKSFQKVKQILV